MVHHPNAVMIDDCESTFNRLVYLVVFTHRIEVNRLYLYLKPTPVVSYRYYLSDMLNYKQFLDANYCWNLLRIPLSQYG